MKATNGFPPAGIASSRRGQALVEFAMGTLVLLMLIFGIIEVARIFLVYTTVTDAARLGVRYAITHGTPPAGPSTTGTATSTDVGNMQTAVQAVVKSFLRNELNRIAWTACGARFGVFGFGRDLYRRSARSRCGSECRAR